jgi:hypothetical protein
VSRLQTALSILNRRTGIIALIPVMPVQMEIISQFTGFCVDESQEQQTADLNSQAGAQWTLPV